MVTDERLNKLWPQPKSIRQLSGEPVPYPAVLPLTISPGIGGESVHRVMDVFELHKNKFRTVQRRVCLNDAEPISDCVSSASSDCKIHCSGTLFDITLLVGLGCVNSSPVLHKFTQPRPLNNKFMATS